MLANSSNPGNVFKAETADDVVVGSATPDVEEAIVVATSAIVVELATSSVDVEEIAPRQKCLGQHDREKYNQT